VSPKTACGNDTRLVFHQVVAVALELRMVRDCNLDEQVALRPPGVTGCALALNPEGLAVLDTGGNLDRQGRLLAHDTVTPTGRAGLLVNLSLAATPPTGRPLLHPAKRRLAHPGCLSAPVALRTGPALGPRRVPLAVALRAGLGPPECDLCLGPVVGRLQVDLQFGPQVAAALCPVARPAAATAEHLLEDVLHIAERTAATTAEGVTARPPGTRAVLAGRTVFLRLDEPLVTQLVVLLALCLVCQHLLCRFCLLELLLGVGVVAHVGVVVPDRLAVGLLDFRLGGIPGNP